MTDDSTTNNTSGSNGARASRGAAAGNKGGWIIALDDKAKEGNGVTMTWEKIHSLNSAKLSSRAIPTVIILY